MGALFVGMGKKKKEGREREKRKSGLIIII